MTIANGRLIPGFRHGAVFYADADAFVDRVGAFIIDAVDGDEPVLVAVDRPKIELLRRALGACGDSVAGQPVRGVGEPIWPRRRSAEIVESQRHEELLNVAFRSVPLWLVCPYDVAGLDPEIITEARRSHPRMVDGSGGRPSPDHRGAELIGAPCTGALSQPPADAVEAGFDRATLGSVRRHVARAVEDLGLDAGERDDLALAAHEVAANSVEHGGGSGSLRVWRQDGTILCEVRDEGEMVAPLPLLTGWELPPPGAPGGRGLWMANQLCDLVQIRSGPEGTTVRLHRHIATTGTETGSPDG